MSGRAKVKVRYCQHWEQWLDSNLFVTLPRRLPEGDALVVHFAAQLDNRMQPLPGHLFGPLQHRLRIDQLRPIPLQLSDAPATLNRIIFAVVRGVIHQLDWLMNGVGKLYHTMQKLGASATALRTVVHVDLELTRGRLLLLRHRLPLGFDHLHNEVTRFVGAAKGEGQRATLFIDDPTRDIFLLASHIVITGLVVATGETTTGKLADFHCRFTINTQAFDMA